MSALGHSWPSIKVRFGREAAIRGLISARLARRADAFHGELRPTDLSFRYREGRFTSRASQDRGRAWAGRAILAGTRRCGPSSSPRAAAGLRQVDVAERLERYQSYVSHVGGAEGMD